MPLNQAQQSAVEYLDGPLLVLAGPGTGKTQLLSAKVEYILQHTDTSPENILCITFTESGAANMRQRLLSMIGRAAHKVNIYTYHALGANLLEQYKNYAEVLQRNFDQPIEPVMQWKILFAIQAELPALDLLKNANISDLISTISSAKNARLSAADLALIAAQNIEASAVISSEVTPVLRQLVPRMKFADALTQVYQPIQEILVRHTSPQPLTGAIEPLANALLRELTEIIDSESIKEKPAITPLTKWKNRRFEKDQADGYRLTDHIANRKLQSFSTIMQRYDQYLVKHGLFDFTDMIEQAICALQQDQGFRLSLAERYQYILLDEFQDTNPSQFKIIQLLTDYERPNVMAVGDDDQAIFAFQGANTSNLIDFQNHYQAHLIKLSENYRSTSEILDFSRQIADQITDSFAHQRHINKRLNAVNNQKIQKTENPQVALGQAGSAISRHEFLSSDAEYHWLAAQISALIQAGEQPQDIAIVTPKHKYIAPLLPYLKAHTNIQIAYEKRENILETPAIYQLTTLARFVYESAQNRPSAHRLLEILSFPFWDIPALSAIQATQHARDDKKSALDYLIDSKDQKLVSVANFLASLITHSFDAPLDLFLGFMVGTAPCDDFRSPFLAYYQNQDETTTFAVYENLSVLRERVKSYLKTEQPKLADFITFLDDYQTAGEAILSTSPYQDSTEAIQILTAHKAKGLEFKYVFLVATDDLSWGNAKGNNNMLALPINLVQIRHTGVTENERLRLFFVAVTRAKLSLTITNSIKDFSGKSPNRLEYLNEYEDSDHRLISPFLPNPTIITHYEDLDPAHRQYDLRQSWLAAYKNPTPELRPILLERLASYRLTPTDLTTFIDIVYAGPLYFYQQKVLRSPAEPANQTILYGNLIHATFEAVTKNSLDDNQAISYFKEQVNQLPLPASDLAHLTEKGLASLAVALPEFGSILRTPHAKAEYNFFQHQLLANQVPITGKIDHFNLNLDQKTIEIYDFKTGNFHQEAWHRHATLYKYALQLGFYKLLLNLSPEFRDFKVTKGHILFVTPDQNGLVHDKVYEFNQTDQQNLLSLIQAVYAQIKTLAFLDNPALALEPDVDRNLKDLQNFVQLLTSQDLSI